MSDTRFCTSCQATRAVEGGEVRATRGVPRWICQACLARKTVSIYKNQSGKAVNVAKLMRDLYARQG